MDTWTPRIYLDLPLRAVREAFCLALAEGGLACSGLPDRCDVALRDLQSRPPPFPPPFAVPTVALVADAEAAGPSLLRLGYRGVLGAADDLETLLHALRVVSQGDVWARRATLALALADLSPATLTPREAEVLHGVLRGCRNRDIAAELGISLRTVKAHMSSILSRHASCSRVELILRYGGREGTSAH